MFAGLAGVESTANQVTGHATLHNNNKHGSCEKERESCEPRTGVHQLYSTWLIARPMTTDHVLMKTLNYPHSGAPMQGYATVPATSDAKEYLRLLMRHKFGLLVTLLLGLALAWLYLISTDKIYETSALVEVKEVGNYVDPDDSVAQTDWNAPTIKEEANLLSSRRVLTPVVDAFGLRITAEPSRIPVLGDLTQKIPVLADLLGNLELTGHFAWSDADIELTNLQVPRRWEDQALTLTTLGNDQYSLKDADDRVLIEQAQVGLPAQVDIANEEPLLIQVSQLDAPDGVQFSVIRHSLQTTVSSLRNDLATETTDSKSRMITVKGARQGPCAYRRCDQRDTDRVQER